MKTTKKSAVRRITMKAKNSIAKSVVKPATTPATMKKAVKPITSQKAPQTPQKAPQREWLHLQYVVRRKSQDDIAEMLGCSRRQVKKFLSLYSIARSRYPGEGDLALASTPKKSARTVARKESLPLPTPSFAEKLMNNQPKVCTKHECKQSCQHGRSNVIPLKFRAEDTSKMLSITDASDMQRMHNYTVSVGEFLQLLQWWYLTQQLVATSMPSNAK